MKNKYIVLYGGGHHSKKVFEHLPKKKIWNILYIGYQNARYSYEYIDFIKSVPNVGEVTIINIENSKKSIFLPRVRILIDRADLVYIQGGNTFYMLKRLRYLGLLSILKSLYNNANRFYSKSIVFAGLSAGTVLITSDIGIAAVPEKGGDYNEVGIKNLKALGLIDYLVYPHYEPYLKNNIQNYGVWNAFYTSILCIRDNQYVIMKNGNPVTSNKHISILNRGNRNNL